MDTIYEPEAFDTEHEEETRIWRENTWVCECGATVMRDSICDVCGAAEEDMLDDNMPYDESMDGDHESALASAGWGTDEDYGLFDSGDEW